MRTCRLGAKTRHVVLVHGLLGWGPDQLVLPSGAVSYWETAVDSCTNTSGLTVLEAGVGPISSVHDRACELYAQIRGRPTDYGAEHSAKHGHKRWGPDFSGRGLHPDWCAEQPIHLVGHSAGGNTSRQLQRLLADDFWSEGTAPSWVTSITCLASPLNGSPAAYLFGCDPSTGHFRWLRVLSVLGRLLPRKWTLEHWGLSDADVAYPSKMRSSGLFSGIDNLAYDVSMQGCSTSNYSGRLDDWPDTYYMSCTARCTVSKSADSSVTPSRNCRSLLLPSCRYLCSHKVRVNYQSQQLSNSAKIEYYCPGSDPDWCHNDGLVPLASQRYPLVGHRQIAGELKLDSIEPPESGRWYYTDSAELAGLPRLSPWDHADFTALRSPLLNLALSTESNIYRFLRCRRRNKTNNNPLTNASTVVNEDYNLNSQQDEDPDANSEAGGNVSRCTQRLFYERLYRHLSCLA